MKIEKLGSFAIKQEEFYKNNSARVGASIDTSSNVVVNKLLIDDLYIKQKGIYYGLYDHNGKVVLPPEYDNYFEIDEKGVLVFRKKDLSKKDWEPQKYSYGFLNVYTRARTYCVFSTVTKLFPGLYDAKMEYVRHYLIKSDCVLEFFEHYQSIEIINDKIVFLNDWSRTHPRIVNNNGVLMFKDMTVSIQDFKYGHMASAYKFQNTWIVNDDGKIVLELPYKKIGGLRNGYAPVSDGAKWGYMNLQGHIVVPCVYLSASLVDDDGYVYIQKTDLLNRIWGSTKMKFTDLLDKHRK